MPNTNEYTRFGDQILQRKAGSKADWQPVPPDDYAEALAALEVERGQPTQEPVKIKRAGDSEFKPYRG